MIKFILYFKILGKLIVLIIGLDIVLFLWVKFEYEIDYY